MDILKALTDKQLLGTPFADESRRTWRTILGGAFGLPLSRADANTYQRLTGRKPGRKAFRELWVIAGRRGGKSNAAAAVANYLATLKTWCTSPGEIPTCLLLAVDRDQARIAFRYCLGLLEASPILSQEIESTTADTIRLRNGIEIVVGTSDKAAVRGRTLIAVILDELSFWGADATEVLRAIRPGMASQPNAVLVAISTAYSQRGPMFEAFKRYYGVDDSRVLVVRAATRDLNPSISEAFIAEEMQRDPQAARAEFLSEFRSDLEAFLDQALIDQATRLNPRELPYLPHTANGTPIVYVAGVDVSGGRNDATAAAVGHRDAERVAIDACRRWPAPHDPVQVAREVATFLAVYKLRHAQADQYGAELSRAIYSEAGVHLMAAPVNRSEAYLHSLPLFTSGRIEIPDEPVLRTELLGLERRTGRSGKDAIDHPVASHDDLANAVALVAAQLGQQQAQSESHFFAAPSEANTGLEGFGTDDGGPLPLTLAIQSRLMSGDW